MSTKIVSSGPGLHLGIPTLGRPIPLNWALNFKGLNPPINFNTTMSIVYGKEVAEARNEIAKEALKQKSKYLFFLGDDTIPPPQALKQLIFRLEQNPGIGVVGGIYCSKSEPAAPLVFRGNGQGSYWDWKVGEFFEVTGLGMDCTLIRTELFNLLKEPWFRTLDEDKFLDGINHADQWTEDIWFCKQVIENTDYKVYADGTIICEHFDVYANKSYTLPSNSLPMRRLATDGLKTAIDIGCGMIDRTSEFPEYQLVRVDLRDECNPDYRCDVRNLPFGTESFDLVFSSHVLEHFKREETSKVLEEWTRLVKKNGQLILCIPNIKWAAEKIMNDTCDNDTMNVLYGAQTNEYDIHYTGFTPSELQKLVEGFGFQDVVIELKGYNIILTAVKRSQNGHNENSTIGTPSN